MYKDMLIQTAVCSEHSCNGAFISTSSSSPSLFPFPIHPFPPSPSLNVPFSPSLASPPSPPALVVGDRINGMQRAVKKNLVHIQYDSLG